jgi:hypothetical protein
VYAAGGGSSGAAIEVIDMRVDGNPGQAFPVTDIVRWYRDMAPSWSVTETSVHRQLVLCVHRWVLERVLLPLSHGEEPAVEDVGPTGRLVWALVGAVPPGESGDWRTWIQLVLADLRRALAWPPGRRTESWARRLFLIPCEIPYARRRPEAAAGPPRRPAPAGVDRPVVTGDC